jgi:hypothetical protein
MPLLNVLNDIPTYSQGLGQILDGHVPGQLQGLACEGPGVAPAPVGKADLHLAQRPANQAPDQLHRRLDPHGLLSSGKGSKPSQHPPRRLTLEAQHSGQHREHVSWRTVK